MVDIVTFTTLQAGGPRGQCRVGYVFWQGGRILNNGEVFLIGTFDQKCRKVCGARFERRCPPIPQLGLKNAGESRRLYGCDYVILGLFVISSLIVLSGLWMIFAERDRFLLFIPELGVVSIATVCLWTAAFAFDLGLEILRILGEIIIAKYRGFRRLRQKRINQIPLLTLTWFYLAFSFALAILIQNAIYTGQGAIGYLLTWFAAAIAHYLFKNAGGKKVPVEKN